MTSPKNQPKKGPFHIYSMSPHSPNFQQSPLLVQRCNGTTAGLGHLEVGWNAHAQIPPQAVNLWPYSHAVGYGQSEWLVPNLRWRTFRYWAVRATVAGGTGWSPAACWGKIGQFLYWLWPYRSKSKSQHTTSKPTSILLQDASGPRQQAKQCNTPAHVFILYDKPKKQINQKEWHVATNS